MNIALEVSTIAIGTAVLAALIVAADLDLGVVRAWQAWTTRNAGRSAPAWRATSWEEPVWSAPRPAVHTPVVVESDHDRDRAEEWLAAAAAHRRTDFNSAARAPAANSTPAVSLRDALAARRREQAGDAAARAA